MCQSVFFFYGIYGVPPPKSTTLEKFAAFSEISNAILKDLEAERRKKSQAKNENFIAGRPKMALLVKLFLNPGVSGDTLGNCCDVYFQLVNEDFQL